MTSPSVPAPRSLAASSPSSPGTSSRTEAGVDRPASGAAVRDRGGAARRTAVAGAAGLATGALTSVGQTFLGGTVLAGLTNGVAPWLVVPFLVGATARGRRGGALLGVLACVAQVPGYYAAAALRGFPVSTTWVLTWLVCGVLGGVVAGLAGHSWWRGGERERGIGAAVLVAAWLGEALVTYAIVLHYVDDAVVSAVAGVLTLGALGVRRRQHVLVLAWLGPALMLAALGFLALHLPALTASHP